MNVFVYGTLTDPDKASAVLDRFEYAGDAVLSGLHRVDGTYPTLAPGGEVEGRLLSTDEIRALDHYEGVDRGLYSRVTVPLADEAARESVAVYVGDPAALDAPVEWPGTGPFAERARAYVDAHDVHVTPS
ncbi:gamma-glutamylcyclotransferase [Halorientalis brevis]|uniref:Gamma-glutamylcyclotransferase n=1 Tax=Halorientalis brevis TaxID=1126241 RepID=A0ABD6C755_9EURY|nr:gamma-glutamylcyclotransferase family protein [Halorientalis brevis]